MRPLQTPPLSLAVSSESSDQAEGLKSGIDAEYEDSENMKPIEALLDSRREHLEKTLAIFNGLFTATQFFRNDREMNDIISQAQAAATAELRLAAIDYEYAYQEFEKALDTVGDD